MCGILLHAVSCETSTYSCQYFTGIPGERDKFIGDKLIKDFKIQRHHLYQKQNWKHIPLKMQEHYGEYRMSDLLLHPSVSHHPNYKGRLDLLLI